MNNIEFDITIIGAGIASLSLLEELVKDKNLKIALIEAGNKLEARRKNDHISQWHHLLGECSNSGFGGTSKTWGGRCVDYNEVDFINRNCIAADWPTNKNELLPFYESSCRFLKIGKPIFKTTESVETNNDFSEKNIERWSLPLRLNKEKKKILSNSNITYFNNHYVNHISKNDNKSITIHFDNKHSDAFLNTKKCIIASGGIESTRILLKSIDNINLGRYYQGHISGKIANIIFHKPDEVNYGFNIDEDGVYTRNRYQPSEQIIENEELLNSAIWLDNLSLYDYRHGNSILSFIYLLFNVPFVSKLLAPPSIKSAIMGNKKDKYIFNHIKNCIKNLPEILTFTFPFFVRRYLKKRKIPGFFLFSPTGKYALHFHAEQQPTKKNKITLNKNDSLNINYSFTDFDIASVIKTHHLLNQYLQDNNIGHLEFYGDDVFLHKKILDECKDGIHQIGTARMGESKESAVVDKNLQVFGLDNVYVLSTAAFPTSSQANPTFLLVVFAKRLAKHLFHSVL